METNHTPGLWAQAVYSPADIAVGGHTQIASARYGLNGVSRDQAIANARLIAAAPELLAALQAIADQTVEGGTINNLARAAIARTR